MRDIESRKEIKPNNDIEVCLVGLSLILFVIWIICGTIWYLL